MNLVNAAGADALFSPSVIAILGDSAKPGRGQTMREHLAGLRYPGQVFSINPKYDIIGGQRAYASLNDLPTTADLVVVLLQAQQAVNAVSEVAAHGAKAAVVVASGFTETGHEGQELQQRLQRTAKDAGLALCGPNCYGVVNVHLGAASYSGTLPASLRPGPVAFFSQSGALTHAVLNPAAKRGVGFSLIASTGNEAVTTMSDYILAGIADPHTRVIATFIEGVRDLPGFAQALIKAREAGKPVVVCKVGRSAKAQETASAHSGAVAGDDRAFTALCEATGAIRVHSLDSLIETAVLLSGGAHLRTPVAFVSISGGGNGLLADGAHDHGIELAELTEATKSLLLDSLPDFATPGNPLDLTGAVGETPSITIGAVKTLMDAPEVGSIAFAINTGTSDTEFETDFYRTLMDQASQSRASTTPMVFFTMTSGPLDSGFRAIPESRSIPLLSGMDPALSAMGSVLRSTVRPAWSPDKQRRDYAAARAHVDEAEAKDILSRCGIRAPRESVVASVDDAVSAAKRIGFPVVIKSNSPAIAHKSDVGCVRLGLGNVDDVVSAAQDVQGKSLALTNGRDGQLLIAEEVGKGLDLLVGAVGIEGLGHLVVVGPGGVDTEVQSGHCTALGPVSIEEARELIMRSSVGHHFREFRGADPMDLDAAAAAVVAVSSAFQADANIIEVEVNPLRVFTKGAVALDALMVRSLSSHND